MHRRSILLVPFLMAMEPCTAADNCDGARILLTTNEPGTFDADWTGEGCATQTFEWENRRPLGEYAMDITSTRGGVATVEIADANGVVVDTLVLEAGVGDDSLDGLTARGEPGLWSISITLEGFEGDGSFDINEAKADEL